MTIVEVVVSAAIVSMVAGGAMMGLEATGKTTADQRERSRADALAQQDQERLRGMSSAQLSTLNQTRPVPLDGTTFTVTSTGQFLNRTTGGTSCTGTGGTADYVKVVSSVTWGGNRRYPVVAESIITPPIGGTLQIRALDQNGAGLPGVTVTAVKGTDRLAATTDANGCVVFAGTELGDYVITGSRAGYVDFNGNPTVTTTVTTTASDTTSVDLSQIGLPGAINAAFDTRIGSTVIPGQLAPALSWNNAAMAVFRTTPALAPIGSASISTPPTTRLFPFIVSATPNNYIGNYAVWAGRCTFDKPPVASTSTATVAPGTTATPTVRLPALIINVSHRNATRTTRVTPASIRLTDACGQTWLPPVIPATPTSPMNLRGQLRYPGQPYSPSTRRYTVCADFVVGGFRYQTSTTTANDNFTAGTPVNLTIDSRFTSNRRSC